MAVLYGRKGSTSKKNKGFNKNIFSPLAWLDLTIKKTSDKSYYTIQNANHHYIPSYINSDIKRQCLSLFIAECLIKTLKHPMSDSDIFNFITDKIIYLDTADSIENIHTDFIRQLSELLGYGGEPIEELENLNSMVLLEKIIE